MVQFTYSNGVKHFIKTTKDDNIFGGVVNRDAHRSGSECHLAQIALRLARKLQWDAERERFTGDGAQDASAWIAREMRQPYDYSYV